jgi:probable rRNA maturation factor
MTPQSLQEVLEEVLNRAQKIPELCKRVTPPRSWDIGAAFISAEESADLCQTYLGKKGPTDVLSFPASHEQAEVLLGDLAICLPVAEKQAKRFKHPLVWEVRVLVVHGVLHLLGFDHEKSAKAKTEMRKWEKTLLGKKGLIGRAARPMLKRNAHSNTRGPRKARRRKG